MFCITAKNEPMHQPPFAIALNPGVHEAGLELEQAVRAHDLLVAATDHDSGGIVKVHRDIGDRPGPVAAAARAERQPRKLQRPA